MSAARKFAGTLLRRAGLLFGKAPVEVFAFVRWRRKGRFIELCRVNRGLPARAGSQDSEKGL